jgi:hypothetical protein
MSTQFTQRTADDRPETDQHEQVYLRRLRRRQLSLSLLGLSVGAGSVAALPLLMFLLPEIQDWQIAGLPFALLMVVFPAFPLYVALGLAFERRATAMDETYREMREQDTP